MPLTYAEYVKESQALWKRSKQGVYGEGLAFSQSVAWPKPAANALFRTLVNHLPTDPETKKSILNSHPAPLITVGWHYDKRLYQDRFQIDYPEGLNDEEKKAWINGLELLTEVATDGLFHYMHKGVAKARSSLDDVTNQGVGTHQPVTEFLAEKLGGKAHVRLMRETLMQAVLRSDQTSTNRTLQIYDISDLNELAIALGQGHTYRDHGFVGTPPSQRPETGAETLLRPGGEYSLSFPGVINYPVRNYILTVLGLGYIPYALAHELIHYATDDLNRIGLIPLKRHPFPKK